MWFDTGSSSGAAMSGCRDHASTSDSKRMDIDSPSQPNWKNKMLRAGQSLVEELPWVGPATAALGPFLPDRFDEDQVRWQEEVTTTLNWLSRLHREPEISRDSLAWRF